MTVEHDEPDNKTPDDPRRAIQKIEASDRSNIEHVTQVAGDYHEHHHYPQTEAQPPLLVHLPAKTYHRFVGRQDSLERIMVTLRLRDGQPVVVVVGLGGIGKTALVREAVEQCMQERVFDHIVWISAQIERFTGESTRVMELPDFTFDGLLSEIARQCGRIDIPKMPPEEMESAIQHLLATRRVLVTLDNLETVQENGALLDKFLRILGQGKLLITSRHHISHQQGFAVDLTGLPEDEGIAFLKEEGRARGINVVAHAKLPVLLDIHAATGGAPLAMKLVAGQMSTQPMDFVLSSLRRASVRGQDYDLYRYIYFRSWELLSEEAKKVLVDMSVFPPLTGGAPADVAAVSQVHAETFWTAMSQLVTMSLVDKTGEAGHERFALHPLTHYFVLSDITGEWGG